ncbi:MAG: AsmA-like C-terminal region-containing protein [Tardiphaga sp.]
MQTTLLGLAIAVIMALVAALIGPYFIDWNQFRPQFEAEASRVVGMRVWVDGSLDARLLPAPSLRLRSVAIGGPNDPGKIRADRLEVEFNLSSLMRGEWRATELTINGAAVDLGLNEQGRVEMPPATGPFNLGALAIDRLNFTGRVALRDAGSRGTLELNDIAFSGDVRSLAAGAMRGDGNFTLAGERYPFRLSSGQTTDGSGTRVHLNLDPGQRALAVDLDGVLNFDARMPRFDGAITLSSPLGLKIRSADDKVPTPWRIAAKVKADPATARLDAVEASYGAEETALKLAGIADIRFGAAPLLHAVLSAKQFDADRLLAKESGQSEPPKLLPALRQLAASIPQPPLPTQIEIGAEQIMLGGRPVQNLGADLHGDTRSWTIDRLEFRAPGNTRVALSGEVAKPGAADGFNGAFSVDSSDPDTLAAWLQGRSDITYRNQKPLRVRGNLSASADRVALEALKAEIDGGTVEGRVAYAGRDAAGGSRFDAELKADRLDLDAAGALIRTLGGPQAQWPDAGKLSLDIGSAVSAGQTMRPFVAQLGYSPKTFALDRFRVGEASGLMLDGSGSFDRNDATGRVALSASSASFAPISAVLAPMAPAVAARLNAMTPARGPVSLKLALDLVRDANRADRANARAVFNIDAPDLKGATTITANPPAAALRSLDLDALSRSELAVDSQLSGAGRPLLALLGLDGALAAGNAPVRFAGSATGAWGAPLQVKASFAGAELDADAQGSAEPWGEQPKAAVTLGVRRANLAPLFNLRPDDVLAQNVTLSSRVTLGNNKLSFENIDSAVAGARLRGRLALTLGADRAVDGQVGLDTIELAPAFAFAIGARGHDVGEPLGRGLLQGWRGQLAFQALRGTLPGGIELRPVGGVVKSDGQSLSIDAIKGGVGGGEFVADIDARPALAGFGVNARVELSNVDGAALRYRALVLPAGKASLKMTLASQGRSASALEGALSGNGLLTIDAARIAGLDPRAFEIAIRASDTGVATDDAKLRKVVEPALNAGALAVAQAQIPFIIKDSRLRVGATTLEAEGARAIVSGGYDIAADQADIRASLTTTAQGSSSVRPEIQVFAAGTPDRLDRTVDVASLSSWLAVRAIDRETKRLDALERGEPLPAAIPPAAAPAETAPDAPVAPAPPRRAAPKLIAPRAAIVPAPAPVPAPAVRPQLAPLPAPIEIRPAPRPRVAPPMVLTPPAATTRPTF